MIALLLAVPLLGACSSSMPTGPQPSSPPASTGSPSASAPSAAQQKSSSPSPDADQGRSGGVASISFDDGTIGQYTYARPVLEQNDLVGTFYLVSDALTWGDITINRQQARELVAAGHEIGNHTRDHQNLDELSTPEVAAEFSDAQDAIESEVGVRPTTCAYPFGSNNTSVLDEAEKQFTACRTTQGGLNERGRLDNHKLLSYYVQSGTTAADVRRAAEQAQATDTWVVFVYHGVDRKLTGPDDVTPKVFADHMKAIRSTGIRVLTVEAAFAAMSS